MPSLIVVLVLAALVLAACGQKKPDRKIQGFNIDLQGHPEPADIDIVISTIQSQIPEGGRKLPGGYIFIEDLPFDCGGMPAWGCSDYFAYTPTVQVAYTKDAVTGALIEELGHWVWAPICANCESWATGGGRDKRFEAWISSVRQAAVAAQALREA